MRKASLGTLFLTVFLDLLGFGLVVPFLPGVARSHGASDLVATLVGGSFSLMQFLFIPLWGRLSDRVGRRPVLLWSIAASALGMAFLGFAGSLAALFAARLFSGMATANIAVAQAYIADITTPENRARGMGMIGMAFGLGFIFGPVLGGLLGQYEVLGHPGALAAFVAAGLSAVNLVMAFFTLPESLGPERRGRSQRPLTPLDLHAVREAARLPGVGLAVAVGASVIFWFAGLEQTFRLFTQDAFGMTVLGTGLVLTMVGVISALVQGGLIHRLSRRYGEANLVRAGAFFLTAAFVAIWSCPSVGISMLWFGSALTAVGTGLLTPSLSSYVSRQAPAQGQGTTLGVLQSMNALARVLGPLAAGLLYQRYGMRGPYATGAVGMFAAALLATRLPSMKRREASVPSTSTSTSTS
jgi:DHA1 family tetracycline resistance protein-like MFS transporter